MSDRIKPKWRATWKWVALFIFAICQSVTAKPGTAKNLNPKNALNRAQEMLLNKNRRGAVQLLQQARNANLKPEERDEILEVQKDVATRFLTDKGQRAFELGLSQLPQQGATALTHLLEADALEDGNLQIQFAMVRAHIAADDCRAAAKRLTDLAPYSAVIPRVTELELQVAWCLDKTEEVEEILKRKHGDSKLSPILHKIATAWLKWKLKEYTRAQALLREVAAIDSRNPAYLYWLWRVQKDQDESAQTTAGAFITRCRATDAEFRRQTSTMIEMCLHLAEVEAYVKSKGAENTDAG